MKATDGAWARDTLTQQEEQPMVRSRPVPGVEVHEFPTHKPIEDWTDAEILGYAAFAVESMAHLRGMEAMLPVAERVRAIAAKA